MSVRRDESLVGFGWMDDAISMSKNKLRDDRQGGKVENGYKVLYLGQRIIKNKDSARDVSCDFTVPCTGIYWYYFPASRGAYEHLGMHCHTS